MFENVESYHRPASVREALALLQQGKGRACIVAGGTNLLVRGGDNVRALIDLSRAGLSYIRPKGKALSIGAATTFTELEESAAIRGLAGGLLAQTAATCGSMQIRNMATIGGNVVNGSPAADMATALLALDASLVIASAKSRRKIALRDYLTTPRNAKTPPTLVVEFIVPLPPKSARAGWSFQKLGRTEVDISLVNVAAGLQLEGRGKVKWARIALGAVAPAPLRAAEAEKRMAGATFNQALLDEVAGLISAAVSPITDHRASAEYRREMSGVFAVRALIAAAAQAGGAL